MISQKHIEKINKVIKDMVFDFSGEMVTPSLKVDFQYQFELIGQRRMISVGEYYDFINVLVEIIDMDERTKKIFSVLKALETNLSTDYRLNNYMERSISEELQYFFSGDYVRVKIVDIELSEELKEKIDTEKLN
jgi:hypothetical protein